jgi:hypothetical protein
LLIAVDSGGTTQPYRPRQLGGGGGGSGNTPVGDGSSPSVISPRAASSGFGFGGGPGFDGVLNAGEGWGGRKRGPLTGGRQASFLKEIQEKPADKDGDAEGAAPNAETGEAASAVGPEQKLANGDADPSEHEEELQEEEPAFENWEDDPEINGATDANGLGHDQIPLEQNALSNVPPNPGEIQWQYVDDQGVTQGTLHVHVPSSFANLLQAPFHPTS